MCVGAAVGVCTASAMRAVCFDTVVGFCLENKEICKRMQRGQKRRQLPWATENTHTHTLASGNLLLPHPVEKARKKTGWERVNTSPRAFLQLHVLPLIMWRFVESQCFN